MLKYLITIIFFFSFIQSNSKTRDINIYGSFSGFVLAVEFDLEYSILNTDIGGVETTTYLKYGSSITGIQGLGVSYSHPIIGFIQFFGTTKGLDIGASYFKWQTGTGLGYARGSRTEGDYLGFEIGYRNHFDENGIFRLTFTPFYNLDGDPSKSVNWKNFQFMLRVSFGYSF